MKGLTNTRLTQFICINLSLHFKDLYDSINRWNEITKLTFNNFKYQILKY